jgi:tRNA-dihydrouridine synthase 1
MPADRPLTIHVSANNPKDFARAAVQAENIGADAIDLNLGCPQRTAYLGHFGSYLLDEEDRNLVLSMIRAASRATQLPVCVKIRLLDTLPRTIDLCRQLCEAGANLIAIHARKRASWERSSAGARNGPADLTQVQEIRKIIGKEFAHVAVITNGNTITFQDVCDNLCLTGALGLMSAEGILDNPALFLPRLGSREEREKEVTVWTLCKSTEDEKRQHKIDKLYRKLGEIELLEKKERHLLTEKERRKLSRKEKRREKLKKLETKVSTSTMKQTTASLGSLYDQADDKLQLAIEYIDLAITFPVKIRTVIFHVRRMIKDFLIQYQLMDECLNCESVYQVQALLRKIQYYRKHPSSFVFDSEKARQEKYALERKRREDGKRKAYEERMIRKAKREGKSDLNFYLKIGAELPTRELIHEFRAMPRERVISLWKERHSQHCLSFHLDSCQRGRSCAFLHIEIAGDNSFIEKEEVAG